MAARCLTVIGALWVGFHGLAWVAKASHGLWLPSNAVAGFPSPDHRAKAVVFSLMGGGPASSYCGDSISVVAGTVADDAAGADRDQVFSASCGALTDGHWADSIKWTANNTLEITFDPRLGVNGSTGQLTMKSHSADGHVHIDYVIRTSQ